VANNAATHAAAEKAAVAPMETRLVQVEGKCKLLLMVGLLTNAYDCGFMNPVYA
jgi:hypothetical protein